MKYPELEGLAMARQQLPAHESPAVSDEELRIGDQVSDEEFFDRIAMPELIGQPPRFLRGRT